jgi:glycosyltransferase involved in cell wall biosynthesis
MLALLLAQRERGHEVELACPAPPPGEEISLWREARAAGATPVLEVSRARGVVWWRDTADVERLRALLEAGDYDVVHAWHTRDHVLAVRAAAERRKERRTRLARTHSGASRLPRWPWARWLFGPATDALLCVSPGTARANARARRGRPVAGAFGAVDLARFAPAPADPALRAALGLAAEDRVVGIVARVQPRRRFDLLLAAMAHLSRFEPRARLLVVGRGTRFDETLREPAARLGLADRIACAGYRAGDYADVLRLSDVFTLLVPGSDGTCRALLEAAACGIPAVTTGRGALPEIVAHGETGLVVDEEPEALARAWAALLSNPARRARLGAAARRRAEALFSPQRLAEQVERLYREAGAGSLRASCG